jgi:riboflavin kinase/FMN adenylyltransferase
MDVRYEEEELVLRDRTVVAIGTFDGVHLGHQAVLRETCALAAASGSRSVVVIFDRHPATVVRPETAPRLLTDVPHRIELLEQTGVDMCVVLRFDEARSLQEPEDFVREVIAGRLAARALVVGEDFHFGRQRRGDTAVLSDLESVYDFKVVGLPLLTRADSGATISSTAIREALGRGDLAAAATMMGRLHEVRGVVEHGDHRGRSIGFPTANVSVPGDMALPADGVYAGWYEHPSGQVHAAAINLGTRPTFYDDRGMRLLEAYLLDFDGDLYGEPAKVRFHTRLRSELKFASVQELVEAMGRDVGNTRRILTG